MRSLAKLRPQCFSLPSRRRSRGERRLALSGTPCGRGRASGADQPPAYSESQIEGITGRICGPQVPDGGLGGRPEVHGRPRLGVDGRIRRRVARPAESRRCGGCISRATCRARIGPYDFAGQRAVVWLQKLGETGKSGSPLYQVFVYFEGQVGTPESDAAITISADRLPIRGIVEAISPLSLKADVLENARPEDAFLAQGENVLSTTLQDIVRPRRAPSAVPSRPGAADQPGPDPSQPAEPGLEDARDQPPAGARNRADLCP